MDPHQPQPLNHPYELVIMRGCSGSGKSTLASTLLQAALAANRPAAIFSTDDFWINPSTGIYTHDLSRLSEAHIWNQTRATTAMQTRSHSLIFIDNTNLQLWEAKPYVLAALAHGYTPSALEPTTQWWIAKNVTELHARGTHGVPLEVIQRMVERYESDWSVEAVLAAQLPVPRPPRTPGQRGGGRGGIQSSEHGLFLLKDGKDSTEVS